MGCGCGDSGMEKSCGCGQSDCGCGTEQKPSEEQMFEMFVGLSEAAWMKALKQRMVEMYAKKGGKDLDQMAEFFVEVASMKWSNYEEFRKKKPEFMKHFMEESQKHKKK